MQYPASSIKHPVSSGKPDNQSNNEVVVSVKNVSKKFCKHLRRSMAYGIADLSKNLLGIKPNSTQIRKDEFWAVDDVSFELRRGEAIGLIGVNGSGKSTLLRLITGIFPPDKGEISVKGRVGALISVGAGFHPHMTGRENIYLNATILGMNRKEIDSKFQLIVDFAEIGNFLDAPVSTYSSGMRMRLGFAIAAHMDPDVLLIDEVLAVGDMGFIMKCLNAVDRMMKNAAVIFVSHNMPFVSRICSQLMALEKGKVVFNDNDIAKGIDLYFSKFQSPVPSFVGEGKAEILDLTFSSSVVDQSGREPFTIKYLEDFHIEIHLKVDQKYINPIINFVIYDKQIRNVAECLMYNGNNRVTNKDGLISVRVTIPRFNMTQGIYTLTVSVTDQYGGEVLLRHQSVKEFRVSAPFIGWSSIQFKGEWVQLN